MRLRRRIAIPQLDPEEIAFPDPATALDDPNGLLAFGGDLRPARLLAAYQLGVFPWYQEPQPILWWSPDPRAVLFPPAIHISRSLRRLLRQGRYRVSMDCAFDDVVAACSEATDKRPDTWITPAMRHAYGRLHQLGHAHSVEVWADQELVGGLYGVARGRVFFGESMFSRRDSASKVALVHLCGQLQRWGFALIDCQVGNDHTYAMGAVDVERAEFLRLLADGIGDADDVAAQRWVLDWFWPGDQ
jgi:leucyl/phenylalanyl-tRNA--protein transferase